MLLWEAEDFFGKKRFCGKQSVSVGSKTTLWETEYLCWKQRVFVGNRIPLWEARGSVCIETELYVKNRVSLWYAEGIFEKQ